MIDKIIPLDIFQNVIFDFCNSEEQVLLKYLLYYRKLEISNLIVSKNFTDEILKTYYKVKRLIMEKNKITDEGIKHMKLEELHLNYFSKITDNVIKHINLSVMKKIKRFLHIVL